ncbi:MAG: SbcC/MukB-like Walker B domain-containing protein, partial [Verrucomicrobiota bacterium]|nr:SbcC/MukB-like Walker B domain-containing protein [Verrucomicrobiota bacterium]
LKVRLAQAVKDREQLGISRKQLEAGIEQAQQKLDGYREQLGIAAHAAPPYDQWRPVLESMQADNADAREQIGQVLNQAEAAENARAEAAKALEKARESAAQVENATLTATHRQTAANQLLERLNQELETLQSKRASDLETLAAMVRTYHVDDLVSTGPDTMLAQLTARRDKWTARQADLADLTKAFGTLEQQLSHRGERIQTIESELTSKESELKQLQSELAQIREERQAAFGEKEPDREEHQLHLNVVAAEKSWASARDRWTEIQKDLDRLTAKKSDLERTLAERTLHLEQTENGFLQQLREKDFPDETAFRNACLPELERKQLTEAARCLADEQADLESRARATQKRLEEEQAKQLTQEPVENLRQTLEDALAQQKALQQDIGAIRQKLDNNNALKRRQAERLQAIEAQTRESGRWDRLHELIGSADGKKFRNFAQGLTFELMIGHANRQLQKMTDRYLLVRDKDQPLELNVMDNYQAGEIRSTKNLSGGESFLVSLSLALGLSQMSSRNVRVDSLFLDEGFGTLDEESLDTALETLAGLQQEGKLIGVISHVGALRERIPTQIQVTPRSGGRSALSGPGCSAGSQRN